MNYLAHLFLAQPSSFSLLGNLMGDFVKGVDIDVLPLPIIKGIKNHRLVDKFTDAHPDVKSLKFHLSKGRQRYAAIISDVVFDHFLAKHWRLFSPTPLSEFTSNCYHELSVNEHYMPERMALMTKRMIKQNWLVQYADLAVTGRAIDALSSRIRFNNNLAGALTEVELLYDEYEQVFLVFFPQLMAYVKQQNIECHRL